MRTNDEVKHAFQPVGGLSPTQTMKMMKIQRAFEDCAGEVLDLVPESADRTYVLRQLLDCKFWAVQAITHEVVPTGKKPLVAPIINPENPGPKTPGPGPATAQKENSGSDALKGSGNAST